MPTTTTTAHLYDGWARFPFPDGRTDAEALALVAIPGSTADDAKLAAWNGHEFEVLSCALRTSGAQARRGQDHPANPAFEYSSLIHYPIDPRIQPSDVRRATIAYPNADNTGWLFGHGDQDAMVDYEKELAAAAVAEFAEPIDAAQVKANEATNAAIRATAVGNHRSLVGFRDAVVAAVVAWARTLHVGWQEQHPHEAHVHLPVLRAVQSVAAAWQTDRAADYGRVAAPVAAVLKALAKPHVYETRWDKADRIAAEEAAAAEQAAAESQAGD